MSELQASTGTVLATFPNLGTDGVAFDVPALKVDSGWRDPRTYPAHAHVFAFRFGRLLARSLAKRAAVRLRAAASDAFLAWAVRSSGVMLRPPSYPLAYRLPCPWL